MQSKEERRKDFWVILWPILLKLIISVIVSIAFSLGIVLKNIDKYKNIGNAGPKEMQEYMIDLLNNNLVNLAYATIVAGIITIPIMFFLFKKDEKNKREDLRIRNKGRSITLIPIVLMAICTGVAFNNLIFLGNLGEISKMFTETSKELYSIPFHLQLIGYGLITPISEELIYRGLIYGRMRDASYSMKRAGFLSALLFSIGHANIVQGVYAFFLGILFIYVYEKKGSIVAPILCHMAVNIVNVIFTQKKVFVWMFKSYTIASVITIVAAGLGAFFLVLVANHLPEIDDGDEKEKNNM